MIMNRAPENVLARQAVQKPLQALSHYRLISQRMIGGPGCDYGTLVYSVLLRRVRAMPVQLIWQGPVSCVRVDKGLAIREEISREHGLRASNDLEVARYLRSEKAIVKSLQLPDNN